MMGASVDILLATYNSAAYLREQLDSLLSQTDRDWRLLIRDAGSADETRAIIDEYAARDGRIVFAECGKADACKNFARLLELSTAEYVMFCDHDDVWLPRKIEAAREAMRGLEAEAGGREVPLLVFSDAVVTDSSLRKTDASSFHCQHLDPSRLEVRQLLLQNVAAGNTMLFNRALAAAAGAIPHQAVMHDHWMILVAALLGRVKMIAGEPQLLYRQHGGNVLGAASFSVSGIIGRLLRGRRSIREKLDRAFEQAGELARRYAGDERVKPGDRALLRSAAAMPQCGWFMRRAIVVRRGIWKNGLMRNLGLLVFV